MKKHFLSTSIASVFFLVFFCNCSFSDKSEGENYLLFELIRTNKSKEAIIFIQSNEIDINSIDDRGLQPENDNLLIASARNNNVELVKLLIDKGVNINYQNNDGFTALMRALQYNNYDIAKLLIESGANIKLKNCLGEDAIKIVNERAQIKDGKPLFKDRYLFMKYMENKVK